MNKKEFEHTLVERFGRDGLSVDRDYPECGLNGIMYTDLYYKNETHIASWSRGRGHIIKED